MKITDVRTKLVSEPLGCTTHSATHHVLSRDILLIYIDTDEEVTGLGFITGLGLAKGNEILVIRSVVDTALRSLLIGEDPLRTEWLWKHMFSSTIRFGRKGAVLRAISGVDIALWDLKAKYLQMPLHQLLGGYSEKVKAYASGGFYAEGKDAQNLAEEIQEYKKQGFAGAKVRVGLVSLEEDTKRLQAIRNKVGFEFNLMVDANEGWDANTAIRAAHRWEELDLTWIEEPLPPYDINGYRRVNRKVKTPIAIGENGYSKYEFQEYMCAGIVDVCQPDVTRVGGITEWIKVAAMADARGLEVVPHGIQEIHLHLAGAVPNCPWLEFFPPENEIQSLISRIFIKPLEAQKIIDGWLELPQQPGIGLEIDQDLVKHCEVK